MNKRDFLKVIAKSSVVGAVTLASRRFYAETGLSAPSHFMLAAPVQGFSPKNHYFAYVGTYTSPRNAGKGIYGYRYDTKSSQLTPLGVQGEVENPSWLTTDPQHRFLYAVTENKEGFISSLSINSTTGGLTFLNKVASRGGGPCHLTVDRTGKVLLVANYNSGSIASFAIKADGSIGESLDFVQDSGSSVDPHRQKGPHTHEMVLSPDNRFLFVPELGLDQIKMYRFSAAKGTFTPNNPPFVTVAAGFGPRHLTFGAGGKFAYLVCEMKSSVMVFSYDRANGTLIHVQTISNLSSGFSGIDNSGEIQVDRSGRYLYASNRGNDSITVFEIDRMKGTLSNVQIQSTGGKIPRNFVIDPSGKILVVGNQDSDRMNVFNLDPNTGKLSPTSQQFSIPAPACILFVPAS